jgi:hypothetical protein
MLPDSDGFPHGNKYMAFLRLAEILNQNTGHFYINFEYKIHLHFLKKKSVS